ncbi:MAG TPA: hypothetical protein VNT81_15165, partial [Vicinamibacterales bacterium]|nr:hypothetical protein [Vicinamibacterales bacterium]
MIRRLRTLAAAAMLLGATGVAHAQHDAKPAAGHSAPATDKSGHAEAKPAAPAHPSKASGPSPAHPASPAAAK